MLRNSVHIQQIEMESHLPWHACRPGAKTCPGPDTDEPKMDPFSRAGSDAKFALWYGLLLFSAECVQWSVCVALYHYTGGRQQGWVQPSKQVEYRWGGTNTVWTCAQLEEGCHKNKKNKKKLQLLLTAQCCSPCAVQNLVQVHLCCFVRLGKTCMHLVTLNGKINNQSEISLSCWMLECEQSCKPPNTQACASWFISVAQVTLCDFSVIVMLFEKLHRCVNAYCGLRAMHTG